MALLLISTGETSVIFAHGGPGREGNSKVPLSNTFVHLNGTKFSLTREVYLGGQFF